MVPAADASSATPLGTTRLPLQTGRTGPSSGPVTERPSGRALVISLFNPKALLFMLSSFSQFVDPDYSRTTRIRWCLSPYWD